MFSVDFKRLPDFHLTFVMLAEKHLKWARWQLTKDWNVGAWIVPTKGCTHFQTAVYCVLDIVLDTMQSEENVILR